MPLRSRRAEQRAAERNGVAGGMAILSTVGGQTGLNLSADLAEQGVLERYGVELIGAKWEAIRVAEDRELFKEAMPEIGLQVPRSGIARSEDEAMESGSRDGLSGDPAAFVHPGRHRGRHCLQRRRVPGDGSPRA